MTPDEFDALKLAVAGVTGVATGSVLMIAIGVWRIAALLGRDAETVMSAELAKEHARGAQQRAKWEAVERQMSSERYRKRTNDGG